MGKLLRDVFSEESVTSLSKRLQRAYTQIDTEAFIADSIRNFSEINYAERLEQITDALYDHLPKDYDTAVDILINSLTGELIDTEEFVFRDEHFINLPLCRYISKHGLDKFEVSMNALKEMTKSFTSEYDIRYFVEKYPEESIEIMRGWADDENLHIRRLASEGSRPRLPMGKRIKAFTIEPAPILPILEKLKNDPVLYVRRSVANSLNDISKDNPDLAADIAERWLSEGFEHSNYVCTHAMRTLYKSGHKKALEISGFPDPAAVDVWGIDIKNTTLRLGDTLEFSFVLDNNSSEDINLMIDYEMIFLKKNKKYSPKVFKIKKTVLKGEKKLKLFVKHPIKNHTTRKHYTGKQYVRIIVNGVRHAPIGFFLQA